MEIDLPKIERKILKFWQKDKTFEKTLKKTKKGPRFVFYEGPPFANGLPGIHHLLARSFKDVILRYKTMEGFFVERKAGWDTHGLPTEIEAEKKLGIKNKKQIEENIKRFILQCRNSVFTYKREWEEFTERMGYWLDLKNAYITCSNEYIESLWWILGVMWDKKLLYQDYKVVPYCPRCGTPLSSHEVALGYNLVKENSIYLKLPVKGERGTYLLIWTTTPWTLPGNVAVAVNPKFSYLKVKVNKDCLILAKKRLSVIKEKHKVLEEFKGKKLIGKEYQPLFKFGKPDPDKKSHLVIAGDFVSTEEGTGLVHIAPAFGEDDMAVGKENNLPILMNVDEKGCFKPEIKQWSGMFVKKADPLIIGDLKKRKFLYKEELYEHEYPFCWRCDTPLLYYAKESWFIKVTAIKKELIRNNQRINWVPAYLKDGRFGEWLKEVKDWNLSRERYWGTPLPIWQCQTCNEKICIGSIEELKEKARLSSEIRDLHRPYIDKITLPCESDECEGQMKRVPEVIDCWFDSGAMPFAQWHYPFENRDRIDKLEFFPADFICEGVDQTRGWFYTLLVISTLLDFDNPYRNVISHGIVLDAKGQKMSKSKGNVIWPSDVIEKYGADVARFYFYTINPVGEPKRFDFKDLQTLYRRFFDTLINVEKFLNTYTKRSFKLKKGFKSKNLLDLWILSVLENLKSKVIEKLDNYDVVGAARMFEDFIDDFSNWYIRRSRKRFQKPQSRKEKTEASQTLHYVFMELIKLLAPFTPFISEFLYMDLKKRKRSVHLEKYPLPRERLINIKLEEKMREIREIINLALAKRAARGIRVRQPLLQLEIKGKKLEEDLVDLIKEEVNVKNVLFNKDLKSKIKLDTKITSELKEEGIIREIIRNIQGMRKEAGLKPKDKILISYLGTDKLNKILTKNKKFILKETNLKDLISGEKPKEVFALEKEIKVDQEKLKLAINKVKR